LPSQAEHFGQPELRSLVAQLRVHVADAQLVRGVGIGQFLRRRIETGAALLGSAQQRVLLLLCGLGLVLGSARLELLVFVSTNVLDLLEQLVERRCFVLLLRQGGCSEESRRNGQQ
jgi:hypothetical protein